MEQVFSRPEHNPETCKSPGHIVIRDEDGNFYCGPGGYWPELQVGIVFMSSGGSPSGYVKGEIIRVNEPIIQP